MVGAFFLDMFWQLRKYGRWSEVLSHLLTAEREVMLASSVLMRTLREASAPYAKDDPFASLLHDAFKFGEGALQKLTPRADVRSTSDMSAVRESQRRAMLAIRDVLLEERTAITPSADVSAFRSEVIDSILRVLDAELVRIDLSDADYGVDDLEDDELADDDLLEDALDASANDNLAMDAATDDSPVVTLRTSA